MGILADLQREAERQRRAQEREQRQLLREYERAQREEERKKLYGEQRERETAQLNQALERRIADLEGLLQATLSVDDHIDLNSLKQPFSEPPFDDQGLGQPEPTPARHTTARSRRGGMRSRSLTPRSTGSRRGSTPATPRR